ncbi:bacteriocin-associated integral membrane family protein [Xylocopilactobacillus apis]|uniref:Bacteriocin-associated integral membrane protein n=1 Tax=Xylocopilactobacillus apis TaxID=2932183 RepID=A0AAU9DK14_9LACO|nr:DUF1430 domain-containing protein [Xylocopilactobacillus apis]BDR55789.1 hypothetical protein KIMC2_03510 [Xylocopilactobacillus apis]
MKKIFLIFSSTVVMLFLSFSLIQDKDVTIFQGYPDVNVMGVDPNKVSVHREKFEEELNRFAENHDIVLAHRIIEPNRSGKIKFKYAIYGKGNISKDLKKASQKSINYSSLAGTYLIVKGKIEPNLLVNKLSSLGYKSMVGYKISFIDNFSQIINKTARLCLFVFLITFAGLSLIYRIKGLRFADIKMISGESLAAVTLQPVKSDLISIISVNLVTWVVGLIILHLNQAFHLLLILFLSLGIIVYTVALILISFILSLLYLFSLQKSTLISLVKGKLPLKRIIAFMLVAQFAAIVTVGFAVKQFTSYDKSYQKMKQAEVKWKEASDRFVPSFGMSAAATSEKEERKREKIQYQMLNDAVENEDALLAENNLSRYEVESVVDGVHKNDYLPLGNTINVTPNYLVKQNVEISSNLKKRLQNLKPGEFGLLFPRKLKAQKKKLTKIYTKELSGMWTESKYKNIPFKAVTGYLDNNKNRFLYNGSEVADLDDQFVKDPIIVVWTPKSTRDTEGSNMYWSASLSEHVLFKGYDSSIKLLKKHHVYQWFSYVVNGRMYYLNKINGIKTQIISLLIGAIMSIITSIFMFTLMNLLYFEEFRKEIFIKRLAGMNFAEIHFNYLLAQLLVLLAATIVSFFLTKNLTISFLTTLLFLTVGALLMYRQLKHEERVAVTVMKGK